MASPRRSARGGRWPHRVPLVVAAAFCLMVARSDGRSVAWDRAVSDGLTQEPVIGLLDLPEIVAGGCGQDAGITAALYGSASRAASPIASIELQVTDRQPGGGSCGAAQLVVTYAVAGRTEPLPTDESGYEIPAAVVYERSEAWFRVALQHGSGWIERQNLDGFHQYPDLLSHSLPYMRAQWDGVLRTAPYGPAARLPVAWRKHLDADVPVDVLEVRRVESRAWLRVRLRTETCGETIKGVTPLSGWIPAYLPSGHPSAWFYSRGC